jgi:hypothetical protein
VLADHKIATTIAAIRAARDVRATYSQIPAPAIATVSGQNA